MRLSDFLAFDNIVVQCHDNPDADALASGFGVYKYLKEWHKNVRLVYSGRFMITKSNLLLMISELKIPIEYIDKMDTPDLLVVVDCQYGEGNVTRFKAHQVAVIDHHQISGKLPAMNDVRSNLGSCATLVRELLKNEGMDVNSDPALATALYYGLMTDTNNFTEVSHPLDRDLRDDSLFERTLITRFRNANLSLRELEIAGKALINYQYDEQYRYAVVVAEPCDPNILGMISDLVLEVDAVDTCLVYSIQPFGLKLSVRSCVKEVRANELAGFITKGIGSGGGHTVKAGGFIQMELLQDSYRKFCDDFNLSIFDFNTGIGDFLKWRMTDYFDDVEIIYEDDYNTDLDGFSKYKRKEVVLGYIEADKVLPDGKNIRIRTLEGDMEMSIMKNLYIIIGVQGEVRPINKDKFEKDFKHLDEEYIFEGEYEPVIRDLSEGNNVRLTPYAKACIPTGEAAIYAKPLDHRVKVFTAWDKDRYVLGCEGDYLVVMGYGHGDVNIVEKNVFEKTYEMTAT